MATLNSTLVNGDLTVTGTIAAAGYSTISDRTLKENIRAFKPEATILDLPIYKFDYIADNRPKNQIGCIAQDLLELFPELVVTNQDGTLAIKEAKLVYPILIELKKTKIELDNLNSEFSILKKEFEDLKRQVNGEPKEILE